MIFTTAAACGMVFAVVVFIAIPSDIPQRECSDQPKKELSTDQLMTPAVDHSEKDDAATTNSPEILPSLPSTPSLSRRKTSRSAHLQADHIATATAISNVDVMTAVDPEAPESREHRSPSSIESSTSRTSRLLYETMSTRTDVWILITSSLFCYFSLSCIQDWMSECARICGVSLCDTVF